MFALLTTAQQNTDTLEDAIRVFESKVVSAAKMQKGFKTIYLLTDSKTGKTVSVSLWDNKDDAIDSERSGYFQAQMNEFKKTCLAPAVTEGYEISVQG